jgi:hypothetical protein
MTALDIAAITAIAGCGAALFRFLWKCIALAWVNRKSRLTTEQKLRVLGTLQDGTIAHSLAEIAKVLTASHDRRYGGLGDHSNRSESNAVTPGKHRRRVIDIRSDETSAERQQDDTG